MRPGLLALGLTLATATGALASPAASKWPAWISIEMPANPFDPSTRSAVLLVHVTLHDGTASVSDLRGAAEGLVAGKRRSIDLKFDPTSRPGVFAVRRQWPEEGAWLVRVSYEHTTAIVGLDRDGHPGSVLVPTELAQGHQLPRAVRPAEIDSVLARAAGS